MKLDRTDALVAGFFAATLMATVGMLFDVWQGVYFSIPILVLWCMLMGSLNFRDQWSPRALAPVIAFAAVNGLLFVVAAFFLESPASLGGLPASTGIFVYIIWPLSAVGAPLVYAAVYKRWIALDLQEPKAP